MREKWNMVKNQKRKALPRSSPGLDVSGCLVGGLGSQACPHYSTRGTGDTTAKKQNPTKTQPPSNKPTPKDQKKKTPNLNNKPDPGYQNKQKPKRILEFRSEKQEVTEVV